ncbi:hypothetical protein BKA70DRAFT_1439932 [Coprinopsis sp. MPI-PUGE-AT-0042]|nr:hypothetical protein BKA70DRAFT_1439932 [Coprinopsis sp. MPI-PUGE-AT-0042]
MAFQYLDFVKELGGIPLQLNTDKGPERAWQHAIQDALRRLLAPDIDPDVFPTVMGLASVHNTVIESLWAWLRKTLGHNLKDIILEGKVSRIYLQHRAYHPSLFYWIFVPLIQAQLNEFQRYWNHHVVRRQHDKHMPSGHVPIDALQFPTKYDPNAWHSDVLETLERLLVAQLGPREQYFRWYSDDFDEVARAAYNKLGKPQMHLTTAWALFKEISNILDRVLL